MTGFAKNGGIPPLESVTITPSKMSYEDFLKRLKKQGVCELSLHNARSWHQEVPENLMEAYLKNRDHRTPGALLHQDALAYARAGIRVR